MRQAFLILFTSLTSLTVAAQVTADSSHNKLRDYQKTLAPVVKTGPQISLITPGNYRFSLPNGNKVHQLKQDNMPCIVPQSENFNMPVLKPAIKNHEMHVFKQGTTSN